MARVWGLELKVEGFKLLMCKVRALGGVWGSGVSGWSDLSHLTWGQLDV